MKINYNNKAMFKFFNDITNELNYSFDDICKEFNLSKGTIKRWLLKKEVPTIYFNSLNRLMGYKYTLNISQKERYKINDMFYTSIKESNRLTQKTISFIKSNWKINLNTYTFIEPSVGSGSFYSAIPFNNKIGLDLKNTNPKFIKMDYFDYIPQTKNNIIIGNPPFGLRGNLALKFINHSAKFSNFICMILPPLFNSSGKGSPKLRINKDFYLAKEFKVKDSNFNYPNGEKVKINSIFQIWTNLPSPHIKPIQIPKKTSKLIKIYSLSNGNTPSSKRNVKMINNCDFYLPSTTFKKIEIYNNFNKLPHNRGYGIVILKEFDKVSKILKNINWEKASFQSTNSANNLRMDIIIRMVKNYKDIKK